jgi:putative endonuclease
VDTPYYRDRVHVLARACYRFLIIKAPKYYVYILECTDRSLYTGITTDLKRRFAEHKKGKGAHYTASHPPRKIVYQEKLPTRSAALKREAQIKKLSRQEKLAVIKSATKKRTGRAPVRF